MNNIAALLAFLSLALNLWQWWAARRFPLHSRAKDVSFAPPLTLLKPLKGRDEATESCLRSWFEQDYAGEVQLLFGVAGEDDPVCPVVEKLIREFPRRDARLVACPERLGANAKVSTLAQLRPLAKHDILVVSDADVEAPRDYLANLIGRLRSEETGLVTGFYRLANPSTPALRWEAVAINADFWSMVLQRAALGELDFALGAAMAIRGAGLDQIGGFGALVDCLADDYELGHRIARNGSRVRLCPVVVDCWSAPLSWVAVWRHQLRWARTIRVCQPGPYFCSILSNSTLWPLAWLAVHRSRHALVAVAICLLIRVATAFDLQERLGKCRVSGEMGEGRRERGARAELRLRDFWFVPLKDMLQAALWVCAFAGNDVEWRGERYRLKRDGTLQRI